jgi:protein-S-isoprenylcysteine O-methyltransferase Ste14
MDRFFVQSAMRFMQPKESEEIMNPLFGKAAFIVSLISMMLIRAPHGKRSGQVKIRESRKGPLEIAFLALMGIATLVLPVISIVSSLLSFADYGLHVLPFLLGIVCAAMGLWLFYRSHADLGTNWSISLDIRQEHQLVTGGVYERIRHPMYLSMFLLALAQVFLLSNWIAGPLYLLAFLLMFPLRLGPEERMMLETFGDEYDAYVKRTQRLIPYVW